MKTKRKRYKSQVKRQSLENSNLIMSLEMCDSEDEDQNSLPPKLEEIKDNRDELQRLEEENKELLLDFSD